jgi:hypothetical protein
MLLLLLLNADVALGLPGYGDFTNFNQLVKNQNPSSGIELACRRRVAPQKPRRHVGTKHAKPTWLGPLLNKTQPSGRNLLRNILSLLAAT